MKWTLKPGNTAKGISLAILQPLYDLLDAIPVPGAKAGIGILLNAVDGIDVRIILPSFWNYRPLLLAVFLQKTSRNSSTLLELENHIRFLTDLLEPLSKTARNNLSSGLKEDVRRLSK
jgi:hypothetical protein